MGKRQQGDPVARRRRLGSAVAMGALPLTAAFLATGAATAAHPAYSPAPTAGVPVTPEEDAPHVYVGRDSATGVRAIPEPGALAAIDIERLHLPDPARLGTVAPIEAPEGKLRFGDTQIDIPEWLPPEQAGQLNDVSAHTEAELARTLDGAGFAPSRADRIAAQTVGTAAVGAAVGTAVAGPAVVAGVLLGGFVGTMAGMPMLPLGTVGVAAAGAAIGGAVVAAPAAAAGAAVGAGVGALNGVLAPATQADDAASGVAEDDATVGALNDVAAPGGETRTVEPAIT
ncbi:hypothetical protein [Nocardia mexicana]|uniref:Uncharacterized protein n=1 Tax=Nocardia mexicana TaxID=279262 RepID=A0A370HER4_9NOCA|nr:hypothetical protein [Nocardia mexicana]RDI55713.1 hypothetical protein DFR68_101547 [Nocardia mexicana]